MSEKFLPLDFKNVIYTINNINRNYTQLKKKILIRSTIWQSIVNHVFDALRQVFREL